MPPPVDQRLDRSCELACGCRDCHRRADQFKEGQTLAREWPEPGEELLGIACSAGGFGARTQGPHAARTQSPRFPPESLTTLTDSDRPHDGLEEFLCWNERIVGTRNLMSMGERKDIFWSMMEKAAEDSEFRAAMLVDAKSAIGNEFDIQLPESINIVVHENDSSTVHLPFPVMPQVLSEGRLRRVSGAGCAGPGGCI